MVEYSKFGCHAGGEHETLAAIGREMAALRAAVGSLQAGLDRPLIQPPPLPATQSRIPHGPRDPADVVPMMICAALALVSAQVTALALLCRR